MKKTMRRLSMVIPVRVVVFWFSISLLMALVSALLAHFWAVESYVSVPWRLVAVCGITSCIGFCLFLILVNVFDTDWIRRNLIPFFDPLVRHHFLQGFLASLALTAVCFIVVLGLSQEGAELRSTLLGFVNNPGGLFALLSGIASFVGIYVTLQSVLEFRQTITSFPQLVDRVCDLIETTEKTGAAGETVRFLAYTPLTGSLALEDRDWRRIRQKIIDYPSRLQIVCLKQNDLEGMHQLYLDRNTEQGKIDQTRIDFINNDVSWLLGQQEFHKNGRVVRKSMNRMPRYYLFANDRRAIIAVPIFLPLPIDGLSRDSILDLPPVHMFGFETSDIGIVKYVKKMFEIYQTKVPDDEASGSAAPPPAALQNPQPSMKGGD